MKYFIDTEFLEGTQKTFWAHTKPTIDLISIGIVAEDGRQYYAISKDFNLKEAWNRFDSKVDECWIRNSVLRPIHIELCEKEGAFAKRYFSDQFMPFTFSSMKKLIKWHGKTNKQIASDIVKFVNQEPVNLIKGMNITMTAESQKIYNQGYVEPKFYGYYSDYDWVVFCWLFGKMKDLPKGFPMYCIDLKQTFDEKQKIWVNLSDEERMNQCISNKCFSEEIDLKNLSTYPKQENEHNALSDAMFNKDLYHFLEKIA